MSIDMAQFHQVFFEESFEGLDAMESGLLNLDMGDVDSEEINTIFRAAHSIKGGSGTFGFTSVSDFTHVMETLLDEMRDGRRKITQIALDVLLGSVDCLREMLTAIQDEDDVNESRVAEHKQALDTELNGEAAASAVPTEEAVSEQGNVNDTSENTGEQGWKIAFSPHSHLLKTGNDPVRMFRELQELGEFEVAVDLQGIPGLYDLDPEDCHLSWNLTVTGEVKRDEIDDIFDWVEDDCDMAIQSLSDHKAKVNQPADNVATKQSSPEPEIAAEKNTAEVVSITKSEQTDTKASKAKAEKKPKGSSSIRVDTAKIDTLINMVGELVITQSMLSLVGEDFAPNKIEQLKNGITQLGRHTRELQESVMNIRMLPISFVFSRFPRLVHDLSSKLNKKIELKLSGENTEVDKTVIELISDPLVHLIRNSLDHGIEMPADRIAAGKPETGTINLNAYHRGGNIVIEVIDDGKGLNKEVLRNKAIEKGLIEADTILTDKQTFELIFHAGFSTAEKLTDVSGRGVGMDVVRKNIQALGGNIEIDSELGKGSTIAIHLPLTLAILDGQSIAVGDERFIVPLVSIIETVNIGESMINRVAGKGETFRLRDEYLPIVRMHEIFSVESFKSTRLTDGLIVVVEGQGMRCGLFIDDLLGQQQVVIKSLEANYRRVEGVSGATILGDGSVALILDIPGLVRLSNQ
jgi:two-component system chemotaxis sensor kinase CheA